MNNFQITKSGYNIKEVDDYFINMQLDTDRILKEKQDRIDELREENFKLNKLLNKYKQDEELISKTLIFANKKASEIEEKSKLEAKLEKQNLNNFYDKWDNFFNNLIIRYPKMIDFSTSHILNEIKQDINNLLINEYQIYDYDFNKKTNENIFKKLFNNFKNKINLLEKKKGYIKLNRNFDKDIIIDNENEREYLEETNKIKRINSLNKNEEIEFEKLLDNFLNGENGGEERTQKNSGFNFDEALNPKEDLSQILKGFKLDW